MPLLVRDAREGLREEDAVAKEVRRVVDTAVTEMWLDVVRAVQELEDRERVVKLARSRGVDAERP